MRKEENLGITVFKIIHFFKDPDPEPDPDNSRPDPQHCLYQYFYSIICDIKRKNLLKKVHLFLFYFKKLDPDQEKHGEKTPKGRQSTCRISCPGPPGCSRPR